jgi:hypothetical protein
MSAPAINQCGTECEWHWFDTDPEHIRQPKVRIAIDQDLLKDRQADWVHEAGPIGAGNNRAAFFAFATGMSMTERRQVAEAHRAGTEDSLEYPLDFIARRLGEFTKDERAEAWELFGQGVEL